MPRSSAARSTNPTTPRCRCGRTSAPPRTRRSAAGRCWRRSGAWSACGCGRSRPEQALLVHRVEPSVAPGITAQQPPPGQHEPAEYAESVDRLHRVLGARGVVLAAVSEQRRDQQPLVGPQAAAGTPSAPAFTSRPSSSEARPRVQLHPWSLSTACAGNQLCQRRTDTVEPLTLSQSVSLAARHDDRVGARRQSLALDRERLAQQPLDLVALNGAAYLPRNRESESWLTLRLFAGTRRGRARGRRASAPGGRRGRNRALRDSRERPGRGRAPPAARTSDRESLAAFCAAALEREPPGTRSHPRAESVRTCSLTFFRLIRAFHGSQPQARVRASIRSARSPSCRVRAALRSRPRPAPHRHPADAAFGRRRVFPAHCANASRPPRRAQGALVYSPPPSGLAWTFLRCCRNAPRRSRLELPTNVEPDDVWRSIREELRRVVGESTYEIWIAPLEVKAFEGGVLLLKAPAATRAWVAKRFGRILERSARSVTGIEVQVAIEGVGEADEPAAAATRIRPRTSNLNPRYSFDQFIIGDGNRLAHAAALAVAELPGQAYNPLFLHAPPGLGKTHLLHAIGNYVRAFGGRRDRPLHDRRGVHQPLHQGDRLALARRLQAHLPRRRRPPDRRRPIPREQGKDRGGVLPHVQRAVRERAPARPDLRPAPASIGRGRGAAARAVRGRPRRRHPPPGLPHARRDPSQARDARPGAACRRRASSTRSPSASPTTSARSRER